MSETSKQRQHTEKYMGGNVLDIASGGDPVVPWAISLDLPTQEYLHYRSGEQPANPIHWQGYAQDLPFKDSVLDTVYASHILEDFTDWNPLLKEWTRVLKPGGYLVIMIPDKERWQAALKRGQIMNAAHRHEGCVGELSGYAPHYNLQVIEDRLTNTGSEEDYNILFVAKKR